MATHSSVLAWRIPGMGEPGGLPSMGSQRVGHDWSYLAGAAGQDHESTLRTLPVISTTWRAGERGSSQRKKSAMNRRRRGIRKETVKDQTRSNQFLLEEHGKGTDEVTLKLSVQRWGGVFRYLASKEYMRRRREWVIWIVVKGARETERPDDPEVTSVSA